VADRSSGSPELVGLQCRELSSLWHDRDCVGRVVPGVRKRLVWDRRMTSPRLRRLLADAESMKTEFAGHALITVEPVGWEPAEEYRITYHLRGTCLDNAGTLIWSEHHVARLVLVAGYPREKPYCTMETPIFHPNFGPNVGEEICLADYWSPGQTLPDIVVKIGAMIQFQLFNVRSPLNAAAARWAEANPQILPVGNVSLFQAEPDIGLGGIEMVDPHRAEEVLP
jgi:ubiquitin-protein ligase